MPESQRTLETGNGRPGCDVKRSTEFGACLVEMAEMSIGDDFEQHRCDDARLLVQGAVGPFDRLFEASRVEMSECNINGV